MSPQHVLLIEDDPKVARTVQLYLDQAGYRVDQLDNGLEALTFLREQLLDLIILDLMLPGLDGLSLCERIPPASDPLGAQDSDSRSQESWLRQLEAKSLYQKPIHRERRLGYTCREESETGLQFNPKPINGETATLTGLS